MLCLLWHFSGMQWKLLLSSASCSLITHCKADRYFHQLHLSLGKVSKFSSSAHAARTKEIYRGKGQEPFAEPSVSGEIVASWAARGVLRVAGRKDKWRRCGKSLSLYRAGEDMRIQWCYSAHFPFRWGLMAALYGTKSRPPLICQSLPKSIHLQHLTVRFTRLELNSDFVITFQM